MPIWLVLLPTASAVPPGEILRDIEHLNVVGSVLYVAAHPDDENTELISWLEDDRGVRTAYLSMTRGGGGQNLVGTEQGELLGVVRTGELLAARGVDGAEQRFTRMIDFGFSKSPDETLAFWGHDDALDDVVRAIRAFRPDVIVTRFGIDGGTHGHHTASAILAREAFAAAADPAYVTPGLAPWTTDRLLHNRSNWNLDPTTDTSTWLKADVGSYDPLTGLSVGEVAATSRTMHKSQGFGTEPEVGPLPEYFVPVLGTGLSADQDLLAGLDLGWSRFEGTKPLARALKKTAARFDPTAPERSLGDLAKAHALLERIPDAEWRASKTADLEAVMADTVGLWLTARAERAAVAPGGSVKVALTALCRAPADVVLHEVRLGTTTSGGALAENQPWTAEIALAVPPETPVTRPHWMVEPPGPAMDTISDPALRNQPDTPPFFQAEFDLAIGGVRMTVRRPVEFAWTDSVLGERVHPLEVLPPATATFDHPGRILPAGAASTTRVTVRADAGPAEGVLRLTAPPGIIATPSEVAFALDDTAPERVVDVSLSAAPGAAPGPLSATIEVGGVRSAFQQTVIDHPHLPRRTVLLPAVQQLVPVDVKRGPTTRVGYVTGSGDAVPDGLRAVGYTVEELGEDDLLGSDLSRFDAIVMGIRAYNTRPRLLAMHEPLMRYVAGGGRLLVQYNTNNRFDPLAGGIGPAPFAIGRERVTDETAEMTAPNPAHPALVGPNVLGPADFEGWVQERGLYFAESWDPAYETLFSAHDPGEAPLLGSTLVAHHGEGVFVYTGLSFFRQLPAGVPGAYRLLANLLALE